MTDLDTLTRGELIERVRLAEAERDTARAALPDLRAAVQTRRDEARQWIVEHPQAAGKRRQARSARVHECNVLLTMLDDCGPGVVGVSLD